jgi:hypothetical protein
METRAEIAQTLAERWCWQAARRDDTRMARQRYRKQVIDGVYRLDEGAWLEEFFSCLQELGGSTWRGDVQGTAVQREMVPCVQDLRLYSLKTLLGLDSMHARPALLCRDEALMRLIGFNAHQVRHGEGQRGAAQRQGPRSTGPICAAALADNVVKLNARPLVALFNGVIRARAQAGVLAAKLTGSVDATDLETTAHDEGCGQVTRRRRIIDKRGNVHAIEVTVYSWKVLVLIEARTKMPLATQVVPIHEQETRSLRALVTQARPNLDGHARQHKVVLDKGFRAGVDRWWLEQRGITLVVLAKDNMAVTADARAHAMSGDGLPSGRGAHTVRQGQGNTAWSDRLETEVVGVAGLTTYAQ